MHCCCFFPPSMEGTLVGSCNSVTPVASLGFSVRKSSGVLVPNRDVVWFFSRSPKLKSYSSRGVFQRQDLCARRNTRIRASSTNSGSVDPTDSSGHVIAPLQLESPVGQFLSQILVNNPALLPAAIDQQLQQLHADVEKEMNEDEPVVPIAELVLYKRIAELKANERKRTLEEILYALVVQKFMEANVPLAPSISQSSDPSGNVDRRPPEERKLKQLHSPEAYEMIKNHLLLILGQRLDDHTSVNPTSKLRVGQVYAASVMYGYFLKRVDQRFQLEKKIKSLSLGSEKEETGGVKQQATPDKSRPSRHESMSSSSTPSETSPSGFGFGIKSTPLRTYVMNFDSDTLQRYATVRSKEALNIIERHTEALFRKPEIVLTRQGTVDTSKDELINMSFSGIQRLVLEAITFGSFLWDVEGHVDSRFHFMTN